MKFRENKRRAIQYWWQMTQDALKAAESTFKVGLFQGAVNRAYYAASCAVTAVLLKYNQSSFKRYSGVLAASHRELIKSGIMPPRSRCFIPLALRGR